MKLHQELLEIFKEKQMQKILASCGANITSINDFTAGEEPPLIFYILADKLGYLLENDPDLTVSEIGVQIRRKLHFIIAKLGPSFLANPQIFENREYINSLDDTKENILLDKEIVLPEEPIIWFSNHAFKDDTLASILAAKRHAYILFGSMPQFYNSFDGVSSWINGVAMTNRKVPASKKASLDKSKRIISYGADLMAFIEGVWNKTPEKPMLDVYNGVYRIACETGVKIAPIVHYMKDNGIIYKNPLEKIKKCKYDASSDPIHTIVDDPIRIDDLSEKAALELMRDVLSSWEWKMSEKYGVSTREEETKYFHSSSAAWEFRLQERIDTVYRYDKEIEISADLTTKEKPSMTDIWKDVALEPVTDKNKEFVEYAKKELKLDFQHRF